jgi:hypothetical protein
VMALETWVRDDSETYDTRAQFAFKQRRFGEALALMEECRQHSRDDWSAERQAALDRYRQAARR